MLFKEPVRRRFFRKVQKGKNADDCWIWIASYSGDYGQFSFRGRNLRAHRFAYLLLKGGIPKGLDVLHKCDNPKCVNPDHLFIGTHAVNMNDAAIKGRMRKGKRCKRAKLNEEAVKHIRKLKGAVSAKELSQICGVTQMTIFRIWSGSLWKSVK